MLLSSILTASILLSPVICSQSPLADLLNVNSNGPSIKSARENGPQAFNAVRAAMRQWDSSLKHNGMSFFAATIPNNTLLYHGTGSKEPITGMEWLAFEIEHAEVFAGHRGGPGGPGRKPGEGGPGRGPPGEGPPGEGKPGREPPLFFADVEGKHINTVDDDEPVQHGYLHTYRTSRPLTKLLYLDGMSAGKTSMGTLDTQDLVLGNASQIQAPWGDYQRAQTLCALGATAGIEGFIRMEAGFELILCNFSGGLDFVSATQRLDGDGPESRFSEMSQFEYVRGVAARYHGISNGRVVLDYSSMVSAFFYDFNLTNPDPKKVVLPRLISTSEQDRLRIKDDVVSIFSATARNGHTSIDWQGITDMIVSRYADRLQLLAFGNLTNTTMLSEINFLLNVYIDYKNIDIPDSIQKCTDIYLTPAIPTTISDHLIHASISSVTRKTCSTLFEVRTILLEDIASSSALEKSNEAIQSLIEYLDWPVWLECGKCAYNEVCFVAIWPWGSPKDHYKPGCVGYEALRSRRGYWDMNGGEPGGPRPKDGRKEGKEDL